MDCRVEQHPPRNFCFDYSLRHRCSLVVRYSDPQNIQTLCMPAETGLRQSMCESAVEVFEENRMDQCLREAQFCCLATVFNSVYLSVCLSLSVCLFEKKEMKYVR